MRVANAYSTAPAGPDVSKIDRWVLLLLDDRPGHRRQAEALAHYLPLPAWPMNVTLRPPWRWLAPRGLTGCLRAHGWLQQLALAPPGLTMAAQGLGPPAAIISCGRRTALAMRALQQHWQGQPRTVQILHCGLPPPAFSWLITPQHDGVQGPNVIRTLGSLNPVDEDWLAHGASLPAASWPALPPGCPRIAVLLGGPSRHFRFERVWLRNQLTGLAQQAAQSGAALELVCSARTPPWAGAEFRQACSRVPHRLHPWQPGQEGACRASYQAVLAAADRLLVSADSVNLLSEACATGKPVSVMGAAGLRGRPARLVECLLQQGYVQSDQAVATASSTVASEDVPRPVLRETQAVAGQLLRSGLLG